MSASGSQEVKEMSPITEERLTSLEAENLDLRQKFDELFSIIMRQSEVVQSYTFEGGRLPVRQTDGAIGYDAWTRAIVDPLSKPTAEDPLRRCMADFRKTDDWKYKIDPDLLELVVDDPEGRSDRYAIALPPNERVMVGLGFSTAMKFPLFYWMAPRSGHASKGVTVANSPGTVDPDYRGEAGALIENNSKEPFIIAHALRIVQIVFHKAEIVEFEEVDNHNQLGATMRASGGFGSTGSFGGKET